MNRIIFVFLFSFFCAILGHASPVFHFEIEYDKNSGFLEQVWFEVRVNGMHFDNTEHVKGWSPCSNGRRDIIGFIKNYIPCKYIATRQNGDVGSRDAGMYITRNDPGQFNFQARCHGYYIGTEGSVALHVMTGAYDRNRAVHVMPTIDEYTFALPPQEGADLILPEGAAPITPETHGKDLPDMKESQELHVLWRFKFSHDETKHLPLRMDILGFQYFLNPSPGEFIARPLSQSHETVSQRRTYWHLLLDYDPILASKGLYPYLRGLQLKVGWQGMQASGGEGAVIEDSLYPEDYMTAICPCFATKLTDPRGAPPLNLLHLLEDGVYVDHTRSGKLHIRKLMPSLFNRTAEFLQVTGQVTPMAPGRVRFRDLQNPPRRLLDETIHSQEITEAAGDIHHYLELRYAWNPDEVVELCVAGSRVVFDVK